MSANGVKLRRPQHEHMSSGLLALNCGFDSLHIPIGRPLAGVELAGCSFGCVLWARVECDCRGRCCLMDSVDHHFE